MKKRSFALLLTALMAACSTRAEKPAWLSVGGKNEAGVVITALTAQQAAA